MCTDGGCGASELAGGSSGLLAHGTTCGTGGDGSGLVGSIAGHMNILFLAYLAPELSKHML